MSINTKDVRDIFDRLPDLGRRDTTPGLAYFSLGLFFGALAGVVIAFLVTPVNGEQARRTLQEKVDQMRSPREREDFEPHPVESTNGSIPT